MRQRFDQVASLQDIFKTLRAIALLILKVVRFSAVGCLLNLRSAFFRSFIAFSKSASNHGLTTCFEAAEDLETVSSAIESKVSVKLAMASGLLLILLLFCCQPLVAESMEGGPIGFLQPPAWFSTASNQLLKACCSKKIHSPPITLLM